jgi:branched-chain amino acid transport system ATP-binding protein
MVEPAHDAAVASPASPPPILEVCDIRAGYGRAAPVLRGLSIAVPPSSVVCLVGPNGAGKSTVLRVVSGMLQPRAGSVMLKGEDITGLAPQRLLARGLAYVLQGHSVFREMTVADNIRMGAFTLRDKAVVAERITMVRDLFPLIGERWDALAGGLSGGQQKMVEVGRSLMLDPDIVLMDEPTMGLDPKSAAVVFAQIDVLRQHGRAVLLVEQNARRALEMADLGCVLDLGRIAIEGPANELLSSPELGQLYLGGRPHAARPRPPVSEQEERHASHH